MRTLSWLLSLVLLAMPPLLSRAEPPLPAEPPAGVHPNILWISAEDLSAGTLGCYGGPAQTPRLDALAATGLRFEKAFSAAPVCAPSRSAIITGVMPTTLGSLPMRCQATPPPHVVGLPRLLREAGYFCTNNAKTDYNFATTFDAGWHQCDGQAHWRGRPDPTQPFFAVFNLGVTHESGLFGEKPARVRESLPPEIRADPAGIVVPPYFPDTPVVRKTLAARLDLAAALDRDVGRVLDQLAQDGLKETTIVVFWSDHGEGIPHGKRFLTEHGLRVPLIVSVPERFAARARLPDGATASGTTDALVNLLDLGPTMLDLAGVTIPAWMEGRSFLGPHAATADIVLSVADRMDASPGFGRSVRDHRFRYVRNFLPWIDGDDLPDYAAGVPLTGELRRARAADALPEGARWFARTSRPADEMYDTVADPDQLTDLAAAPARRDDVRRLREALLSWMRVTRDTGILPEPILRREARDVGSEWAIFHPGGDHEAAAAARYDHILAAAWDAAEQPPLETLAGRLASPEPAVRFWAVSGVGWAAMRQADDEASALLPSLLADPDPVVRINAARWVAMVRRVALPQALDVLAACLRDDDPEIRLGALVTIEEIGDAGQPLWKTAAALDVGPDEERSRRIVDRLRRRIASATPSP